MTSEQLHTALYEKLSAELKAYQEQLMAMPPSEILKHTFEHTVKEDIVCVLEDTEFDDSYVRALLRLRNPLDAIFEEYRTRDTQHMDILRDCFEAEAKTVIKRARDKPKKRSEVVR